MSEKRVFILPFYEHQRGWYEIEAESLSEARRIVDTGDFTENCEPQYRDGVTEWDVAELYEKGDK